MPDDDTGANRSAGRDRRRPAARGAAGHRVGHPAPDAERARTAEERFLEIVLADPTVAAVLERAPALGLGDWWLTAGVLFQTVWNALTGRPPGTGIRDADFFYFDADTSWDAEDAVIRAGGGPVRATCRCRWRSATRRGCTSGTPTGSARRPRRSATAPTPSTPSPPSAAATASPSAATAAPRVYAPHGYDDLFSMAVRPNPRLAPRHVYETKAARWRQQWPELTVLPWPATGGVVPDPAVPAP